MAHDSLTASAAPSTELADISGYPRPQPESHLAGVFNAHVDVTAMLVADRDMARASIGANR